MNELKELVSAIIPVYNGEKYLADAVDSILAQTYDEIEIIIVDDGSTDKTKEIALSYQGIKYLHQPNKGVAAARNLGIKNSTGHFISFLDADDLWLPQKISKQIRIFKEDPSIDIVTGYVEQFVSPELDDINATKFIQTEKSLPGYAFGAILVKRHLHEELGLFSEENQIGETINWFINIFEKKLKFYLLPDIVLLRRIHGNNMSIVSKDEKNKEILRSIKRKIDRKRSIKPESSN